MRQLVQLQERYDDFKQLDTELVSISREEKLGVEGLGRIRERQGVKFVLLTDYQNKQTPSYSQGAFLTYIIDKQGIIRAVLPGTTHDRPPGQVILETARRVLKADRRQRRSAKKGLSPSQVL